MKANTRKKKNVSNDLIDLAHCHDVKLEFLCDITWPAVMHAEIWRPCLFDTRSVLDIM